MVFYMDNCIVGKRFGHLIVLNSNGIINHHEYVHCKCDCGNECDVLLYNLKSGNTKSCGCLKKQAALKIGRKNKKNNYYDLKSKDYGIGYINDSIEFYFDREDYNLINRFKWHVHKNNYIRTCYEVTIDENNKRHNKYIMLHQLLSKEYYNGDMLDHINGKPWDNRKENLRPVTQINNAKNRKLSKTNTSGHKGVRETNSGKWAATISSDLKKYNLGVYEDYEEAVKAREDAEEKLFKEYNRDKNYL